MDTGTDKIAGLPGPIASMKQAAETALYRKHHSQTHSYISQHTWQMIEDRQRARENNQLEEEKRLNREIAKKCKKRQTTMENSETKQPY